MTKEEVQGLKQYMLSKQYLENLAYAIWEADGRLDGEQVVETFILFGFVKSGKMKLKDLYWQRAEVIRDFDLETIRDLEIVLDDSLCERK